MSSIQKLRDKLGADEFYISLVILGIIVIISSTIGVANLDDNSYWMILLFSAVYVGFIIGTGYIIFQFAGGLLYVILTVIVWVENWKARNIR